MNPPPEVLDAAAENLKLKNPGFVPVSGGCINHGGRLSDGGKDFFLKWNDVGRFPGMFETESNGLKLLSEKNCVRIPNVIAWGETTRFQYLVMEFIDSAPRGRNFWRLLGERLAALHQCSSEKYGLDHDNYIGSLPQLNSFQTDWVELFVKSRLMPQVERAEKNSHIGKEVLKKFDSLYDKLDDLLPNESASLLHGDLWSGNLIVDELGEPCLIDPAVYYGHREIELAFTRLFGGFNSEFYSTYHDAFPLVPGFEERIDIYNLYPLLVHLNLFGASYLFDIKRVLDRYC